MPSLRSPITTGQYEQLIEDLSQLPAYTIGRGADNTIVIPNGRVSGHHARLIQCTANSFIFEDNGSKNGSFVNGVRVARKIVDSQDVIQLADSDFTVSQLLELRKTNRPEPPLAVKITPSIAKSPEPDKLVADFTREFADLQQVYIQYPLLRRDCRNREKMIRTGSVILSSIVGIGAALSTGGAALPLLHILSGAGLSILVPTLCSTLLSTEEKLELIDKEYRDRYRCPNPACRDSFGTREWESLAQQKTCRRCQAVWVN
jgi:hypothetical protein